jgi:general secretion pathway protein D
VRQSRAGRIAALALLAALAAAVPAGAQQAEAEVDGMVTLDFADVELAAVIETIAKMTRKNFIYDDRVRGRVTIVSPTPMPVEQAYAVFESVLQVKGFTTVTTPGGAIKVVPVREAKESSVETVQSSARPPDRDRFVTRLIPLNYIDADSIVNTLKPLVSKDAAMAAYAPTNTVILTESASNIRRLIAILESIDVETYKEELAVINVEHADAATLADQVSEIYGAEVSSPAAASAVSRRPRRTAVPEPAAAGTRRTPVRILTDERTNSLLVLAPRQQLEEVRQLVAKLDVPVTGGGRIHVYYLRNANAEELAQTLGGLVGGVSAPASPPGGAPGQPGGIAPAIRSAVTGLVGDISITADPATNSLIIQASQEGFNTLKAVIEQLDVERPQVLVEALIMEVDVSDGTDLGFSGLLRTINGDSDFLIRSATDAASAAAQASTGGVGAALPLAPLLGRFFRNTLEFDDGTDNPPTGGSLIDAIIRLSATDGGTNILSAPHILTSDNEQAEIRVGDNIPIISSRVQQPTGADAGLSTSVNVERQDVGVTLRVTPQITEGDSLRLEIFQEISAINESLDVGNPEDVGVPLSLRKVENTVVVKDGETVVVGGLVADDYQDTTTKVPWLGDIPVLGWAFKTKERTLRKVNLLVFLTPHIVRTPLDLEHETIRKREEFRDQTPDELDVDQATLDQEEQRYAAATETGLPYLPEKQRAPVVTRVVGHSARYPVERMAEIERMRGEEQARIEAEKAAEARPPQYFLQAAIFGDADAAAALLTDLIDSGHDGTLIAQESGDSVLYELQLGPYANLQEAELAAGVVRRSHGLSPSVIVLKPENGDGAGPEADPQAEAQPQ